MSKYRVTATVEYLAEDNVNDFSAEDARNAVLEALQECQYPLFCLNSAVAWVEQI